MDNKPVKISVFFCRCGGNISDKVDAAFIEQELKRLPDTIHFKVVDFLCGEEEKNMMEKELAEVRPDRVVVVACSPRDHEETFRRVLVKAGINPYLMQMVNIREHVSWVTVDKDRAVRKAAIYIKTAIRRVKLHKPLEKKTIDIIPEVLVIGAGVAGIKAALSLAQAGRKVTVVEKGPVIGGLPVRYEDVFPDMECGPCMLEPMMGEFLHGDHAHNIELLLLSEVSEVKGFFGNFQVKIRKNARFIDPHVCIGCGECVNPCPVSVPNDYNFGRDQRKAIYFPFAGGLPNAPVIDWNSCQRSKGTDCSICKTACPMPEAVNYEETPSVIEKNFGAVILAIGASLYDVSRFPNLGYGTVPDVVNSLEFERLLASNGPTQGKLEMSNGEIPKHVSIIHCVGSLDKNHAEYCSGICCQCAFKYNSLIAHKAPGTKVDHFLREVAIAGKSDYALYQQAHQRGETRFFRYNAIDDLKVIREGGSSFILSQTDCGKAEKIRTDMVVLCPALIPSPDTEKLSAVFEIPRDKFGFFEELHPRVDSGKTKIRGIFMAGTCQSPMDIQKTMNQGVASSGYILSELVEGRKIEVEPINAQVNSDKCSGCKCCILVCPYKAISFDEANEVAEINPVLCQGCGTCVPNCPSGSIIGNHFTNEEILEEIEGMLS
ncbi:MAG: CoB--CoM heterodisulfide reductase iron-sulfur subunit A family protein [Candidatus Riflebacteria bacterium]|nr:CoB--CoM heterodisulfide reductase iron-sulfur subunit A family protein [Candidatus Riflebacteria bacterium]